MKYRLEIEISEEQIEILTRFGHDEYPEAIRMDWKEVAAGWARLGIAQNCRGHKEALAECRAWSQRQENASVE